MREESAPADGRAARIAARQHGAISVGQLRNAGIDKSALTRRLAAGRIYRIHRGVYAVGHPGLSVEGVWMAAVLACGDGAVLSHGSAAALWGLLRPHSGPVDVSVPSHGGRRRRVGVRLHRCASLAVGREAPRATTRRRGIPVTTPARTIEDLRGSVPPRLLRRAIRQAQMAGLQLDGAARGDRTRSDLELDFLHFCRRHDLPAPEVNIRIGRWTVDFLWRAARLVVETDSFGYHRGSVAFEDDHARDLELRARGYEIRRFTGRQLREKPTQVAADLRDALASAS